MGSKKQDEKKKKKKITNQFIMLGKIFSRVSVTASNKAMAMRRLSTSLRGRIPSDDGLDGGTLVVSICFLPCDLSSRSF
ncbi:unnamed protein product [Camellia sinensis]